MWLDNNTLLLGSGHGVIKLWDLSTGSLESKFSFDAALSHLSHVVAGKFLAASKNYMKLLD
jgi:hypothetical protein